MPDTNTQLDIYTDTNIILFLQIPEILPIPVNTSIFIPNHKMFSNSDTKYQQFLMVLVSGMSIGIKYSFTVSDISISTQYWYLVSVLLSSIGIWYLISIQQRFMVSVSVSSVGIGIQYQYLVLISIYDIASAIGGKLDKVYKTFLP